MTETFSKEEIEAAAKGLCFYQTRPCHGEACGECRHKAVRALLAVSSVRSAPIGEPPARKATQVNPESEPASDPGLLGGGVREVLELATALRTIPAFDGKFLGGLKFCVHGDANQTELPADTKVILLREEKRNHIVKLLTALTAPLPTDREKVIEECAKIAKDKMPLRGDDEYSVGASDMAQEIFINIRALSPATEDGQ